MPITYNYIKDNDRYAQLYRLQELLRIEHNKEGAKYKQGLITKQQWETYLSTDFEEKQQLISGEICKIRQKIKVNTSINTDLTDVVI